MTLRDRGSATIWVLASSIALSTLAFVSIDAASAVLARHRAQAAADLAALTAAEFTTGGASAACPAAARIVASNGGRMTACRLDGLNATVTVVIPVAVALPGVGPALATARAGPVSWPSGDEVASRRGT